VLGTVADLASRLIATCPRLHLLATSREILRIEGERVEELTALELPQAGDDAAPSIAELLGSAAVGLFLDRAADSGPAQPVPIEDPETRRTLVTVALRLEGIPLAIELAAARMGSLTLTGLAQRLNDRFRLLSTGDRTAAPRHQTLRAALDWSYDLLAEPEQQLLDRLGVFAGSFPLDAVQIVCGDDLIAPDAVPELLASLVDKSLVIAQVLLTEPRYRLLEMIRAYAVERLAQKPGEHMRMARRHADYYRTVAEQIDVAGAKFEPIPPLEGVLDNMRGALTWALGEHGDADLAAALAAALRWMFLSLSLNAEGTTLCERVLAALGERARPRQEADLQRNIATFCWFSNPERTYAAAGRASTLYRLLDDRPNLSNALAWQAQALYALGERTEASRLAAEALEVLESSGHERIRVLVLTAKALTMPAQEASPRWRLLDEALALCERHAPESAYVATLVLSTCAHVAFESGDLERARDYARRHIDESPKEVTTELALAQLAYYALAAGDVDATRVAASEALTLPGIASRAFFRAVRAMAGAASYDGDPIAAAHLLGAVEALEAVAGQAQTSIDLEFRQKAHALVQAALRDEARLAMLLAEGRALTPEQVTRLALAGTAIGKSTP
jgi:predicted ATPase